MISLVGIASNPAAQDIRQCFVLVGILVWVFVMTTAVRVYAGPSDSVSLALPLAKDSWPRWVVDTIP